MTGLEALNLLCRDFPDLRIERGRVRPLWISGFWDVPRDGMATLDGRYVWYSSDWSDDHYWLIELSVEEVAEESAVHEDFVRLVSSNSNIDEYGRCSLRGQNGVNPHEFYLKHAERDSSHYGAVVGWFEWTVLPGAPPR